MYSDQDPNVRFILDQTNRNANAEMKITVWNPEEDLCGHLELSSTNNFNVLGITIYFEGEL